MSVVDGTKDEVVAGVRLVEGVSRGVDDTTCSVVAGVVGVVVSTACVAGLVLIEESVTTSADVCCCGVVALAPVVAAASPCAARLTATGVSRLPVPS